MELDNAEEGTSCTTDDEGIKVTAKKTVGISGSILLEMKITAVSNSLDERPSPIELPTQLPASRGCAPHLSLKTSSVAPFMARGTSLLVLADTLIQRGLPAETDEGYIILCPLIGLLRGIPYLTIYLNSFSSGNVGPDGHSFVPGGSYIAWSLCARISLFLSKLLLFLRHLGIDPNDVPSWFDDSVSPPVLTDDGEAAVKRVEEKLTKWWKPESGVKINLMFSQELERHMDKLLSDVSSYSLGAQNIVAQGGGPNTAVQIQGPVQGPAQIGNAGHPQVAVANNGGPQAAPNDAANPAVVNVPAAAPALAAANPAPNPAPQAAPNQVPVVANPVPGVNAQQGQNPNRPHRSRCVIM